LQVAKGESAHAISKNIGFSVFAIRPRLSKRKICKPAIFISRLPRRLRESRIDCACVVAGEIGEKSGEKSGIRDFHGSALITIRDLVLRETYTHTHTHTHRERERETQFARTETAENACPAVGPRREFDLDLRSLADPDVNRAESVALTYCRQNDHVRVGRHEKSTCPRLSPTTTTTTTTMTTTTTTTTSISAHNSAFGRRDAPT